MTDVFIAYAREDSDRVRPVAEALQAEGWDVWWDPSEPLLGEGEMLDSKLNSAGAVLVVWSTYARASEHVRAESATGLYKNKLIQTRVDYAPPPRPFDQIEVADLSLWSGELDDPNWRMVVAAVQYYAGAPGSSRPKATRKAFSKPAYVEPRRSIRVVPALSALLVGMIGAGAWFVDPFDWRGRRPAIEGEASAATAAISDAGFADLMESGDGGETSPVVQAAWSRVDRDDPRAVRAFLANHSDGAVSEQARSLLRVMDAQAWMEAVSADTEAAYNRYLRGFPEKGPQAGAMAAAAQERLTELGEERLQAVAHIQRSLTMMNLYTGAVDGRASESTARAVRTFAARAGREAPNLATSAPRDLRTFGDIVARSAGGAVQPAQTASLVASAAAEDADRRRLEQARAAAAATLASAIPVESRPGEPAATDADGLAQVQLRRADEMAWSAAQSAGTVVAYQSYLSTFPDGAEVIAARAEIERLLKPAPFAISQLAEQVRAEVDQARRAQTTANARAGAARQIALDADAAAALAREGGEGVAVITAPDGDRYETQVADNTPNGLGVRVDGDAASAGDRYRGQLRNGLGVGLGVYEFGNNPNNQAAGALRYEGEHAGDAASGHGVTYWRNGDRLAGEASRGVLTYANGARYEGQLRNGARHGIGVFWTADGDVQQAGRWENGELVEAIREPGP